MKCIKCVKLDQLYDFMFYENVTWTLDNLNTQFE